MPELIHGKAVDIAPGIRRVTAPNPGVMTDAGTNTFLFGYRDVAVVDPGPDIPEHVEAILKAVEAGGGKIKRIFATHTHIDHSPATESLLEHCDAEVIGALAPDQMFQDETFKPDIECVDEQLFETDEYSLQAIHTPGHVSNHFCFLETRAGLLLTGDHIMNGSTVVIVPPSGDMGAYIASLQKLLDYPIRHLGPAHGDIMDNPKAVVEWLVQHRLGREKKVVDGLTNHGPGDLDQLVKVIYDDVDPDIHAIAKLSLLAHLIKLEQDGRARSDDEIWQLL